MKRYVYSDDADHKLLRKEERIPMCGEAFCDRCGDCLHCYGADECWRADDKSHWWVEYERAPGPDEEGRE